jgi:hypothetical protein
MLSDTIFDYNKHHFSLYWYSFCPLQSDASEFLTYKNTPVSCFATFNLQVIKCQTLILNILYWLLRHWSQTLHKCNNFYSHLVSFNENNKKHYIYVLYDYLCTSTIGLIPVKYVVVILECMRDGGYCLLPAVLRWPDVPKLPLRWLLHGRYYLMTYYFSEHSITALFTPLNYN